MKWSDEPERYAGPCLTPEELERLALGTVAAHQRERLVDHLVGCQRCAQLLQELRSLSGWASDVAEVRPAFPYVRVLAVAALVALALGFFFMAYPGGRPLPGDSSVRGGSGPLVPSRGARLAEVPQLFEWPDQSGAVGYRLRLFDDSAELWWSSELLDHSSCELPPAIARRLTVGSSYSWTIEVEGSVRRGELGPFTFVLEGPK